MQQRELAALYAQTQYRVRHARGGYITIRIGHALPATLVGMLPGSEAPWAFVTAWNPQGMRLSVAANRARQRELLAALRAAHATLRAGVGVADDGRWREASLFVVGPSFARIDRLMRPFRQHAIVRGQGTRLAELHWLD